MHFYEDESTLNKHRMTQEQLDKYQESMNKALIDKCFFMNYVSDYDVLVDFGCADGSLVRAAQKFDEGNKTLFIGYDISPQMINGAESKTAGIRNILWTTDWDEVASIVAKKKNSLLVMNSVLHEVYSYSSPEEYLHFWTQSFKGGFNWISIRDMMMRKKHFDHPIPEDELDAIKNDYIEKSDHGEEKLLTFEDHHGEIKTEGQLIHLFMKDNYWDNWEREVAEDYLGVTIDEFFQKINTHAKKAYEVDFWEPFTLIYLKNAISKAYGYDIHVPTHIKMILKAK